MLNYNFSVTTEKERLQQFHNKEVISFNPFSRPIIFDLKMSSAFTSAANTQVHFRLDFIMEANTMSPDQTAPV